MKLDCIQCSEQFEFEPKRQSVNDVVIVYLECPACEKRYLSFVEDQEIQNRLKKTKRLRTIAGDQNKRPSQIKRAQAKLQDYVEDTRKIMKRKEGQYAAEISEVIK